MLDRLADWADAANHSLGIIAREFLPRETAPVFAPEPPDPALPPVEVSGVVFDDPRNPAKVAESKQLIEAARMVTYFGPDKELTHVSG